MKWFKRVKEGITTSTKEKKEIPDGLWSKCPDCGKKMTTKELEENFFVCFECNHHYRIGSEQYFKMIFDDGKFKEQNKKLISSNPLEFVDKKPYSQRIEEMQKKTGLNEAVRTARGTIGGHKVMVACMDFNFIGGSMGTVVGEKIARAIDYSRKNKKPLIIISKSGGARMMEAAYSLMQMAKTSAKLAQLSEEGVPYISYLTDPTTGGVSASFAMLGDFNIAEPKSLIGFAGPRVIKETIGKELPPGFQSAEFLLDNGFLDFISDRKNARANLMQLLDLLNEYQRKEARQ